MFLSNYLDYYQILEVFNDPITDLLNQLPKDENTNTLHEIGKSKLFIEIIEERGRIEPYSYFIYTEEYIRINGHRLKKIGEPIELLEEGSSQKVRCQLDIKIDTYNHRYTFTGNGFTLFMNQYGLYGIERNDVLIILSQISRGLGLGYVTQCDAKTVCDILLSISEIFYDGECTSMCGGPERYRSFVYVDDNTGDTCVYCSICFKLTYYKGINEKNEHVWTTKPFEFINSKLICRSMIESVDALLR